MSEFIVIFGATVHADGRPSPALVRRVEAAVAYGKARGATYVVTGGAVASAITEASVMAGLLRRAGIAEGHIIQEPHARNTLDSVRRCLPLLSTARRVMLCTDDFHLPRCRWLFWLAGVATEGVPAHPQSRRAWPIIRELIAVPVDTMWWMLGL